MKKEVTQADKLTRYLGEKQGASRSLWNHTEVHPHKGIREGIWGVEGSVEKWISREGGGNMATKG